MKYKQLYGGNHTVIKLEKKMTKGVIKFSSAKCNPCKAYSPTFKKVAEDPQFLDWNFSVVDVDSHFETAQNGNVRTPPTTLILIDGELVHRALGVISQDDLEKRIQQCQ
jgi:thioredoxin 1